MKLVVQRVQSARVLVEGKVVGEIGRGALIRDEDLVAAVQGGTIAGAVLDVFRTEPLPANHPFWSEEKIMVLPHIGGLHPQRDGMVAALLVENLRRFVEGAPLTQLVDRKAGY